ncbi:methyltransferase domain-containing protein [Streptomyces sp. NBC_01022]|uniref:methyltransferase domain-containing protein n=1 Tax=Streptomyces sp. NBC_01022 TaxID=2903723 RepID=UPI002DD9AC22|nr:methyltransferase domain-containing protein [Streptomyces sp. NBC_01022]WRZ81965.1 methyltransferase domain-containing protein [Streptomyces sp. NBC_01022]
MNEPSAPTPASLRAKFAAALGDGQPSEWLTAFATVPRELFVPRFHQQDGHGRWHEVSDGDPGYLETVYSDTALTTQLDEHGLPTSSSSEPRLMLAMLDALGATPGDRLYEMGLGTGYNAALLSSVLGDDSVVSVDVDPELVRLARHRLAAAGYYPFVCAGDGAEGRAERAPYDRIIATAGLRHIPPALLSQAHEGTVVVAPIGYGVVRAVVSGGGEAAGRFLPVPAFFMRRRGPARNPDFSGVERAVAEATTVPVSDVLDRLRFPLSLALPGYSTCSWRDETGQVTGVGLWAEDGSTATAHAKGTVRQIGPERLWDTVERLVSVFPKGVPAREDFGLTITPDGQRYWYRDPKGPCWPAPSG